MRYLLDSNACIALLNNTSAPLLRCIRLHRPSDIGLSAIVTCELYCGACKSRRRGRNLELVDRLAFEVVPFDASDARVTGAIRSELEIMGRPIGPYDLLIAGQARARGLTLITANSREFLRVKDLDCEDWSRAGR